MGLGESEHIGTIASTRATPTWSTSRPRGRCGAPAATAGSTRRPTAARPGSASSTSRTTPARRGLARSARTRNGVRHDLPAPPPRLDAAQRRPGVGHLQVDRRRRHLAQDRPGPARGRPGSHRPVHLAGRPRRDLRASSTPRATRAASTAPPTAARAGSKSLGPHRRAATTGTRSSATPTTSTRSTRSDVCCTSPGRREELLDGALRAQARRSPRHVDRPGGPELPPGRQRRGSLRELRPRRDLAVQGEPADHPVLPRERRQPEALLLRLRRHPGQQLAGRPEPHAPQSGISNEDWFITVGGDGYEPASTRRTRTSSTPSGSTAGWCATTGVRGDRRHPTAARAGRGGPPLELGLAPDHLARTRRPASTSPPAAVPLGRPGRLLDRHLRRPQPQPRPRPARGHGQVWEHGRGAKNMSTSDYGNIVSLSESPLVEGLIYVGTDDGLIQVTEDGGESWRRSTGSRRARADLRQRLEASLHDDDTVYADLRQPQAGRLRALRAGQPRPRPHLDVHRRRPAGPADRLHPDPGPREAGAALRRHRVRPLRHARRGRALDQLQGGLPTIQVRDLEIQRDGTTSRWPPSAAASTSSTTTRRCGR